VIKRDNKRRHTTGHMKSKRDSFIVTKENHYLWMLDESPCVEQDHANNLSIFSRSSVFPYEGSGQRPMKSSQTVNVAWTLFTVPIARYETKNVVQGRCHMGKDVQGGLLPAELRGLLFTYGTNRVENKILALPPFRITSSCSSC